MKDWFKNIYDKVGNYYLSGNWPRIVVKSIVLMSIIMIIELLIAILPIGIDALAFILFVAIPCCLYIWELPDKWFK